MKLNIAAAILLLFAHLATALDLLKDWGWAVSCGARNPTINTAVQTFCEKDNLYIPSSWGNAGYSLGDVHIAIHGDCNPAQYVPMDYCYTNFQYICAMGEHWTGEHRFGKNGCQTWRIRKINRPANPEN